MLKRLARIPYAQIRDTVIAIGVLAGLLLLLITPILLAFFTPPSFELVAW